MCFCSFYCQALIIISSIFSFTLSYVPSIVAPTEPEPEDDSSTSATKAGDVADDGAVMQHFLQENFGEADKRGNVRWDATGAEGGTLKICLNGCDLANQKHKLTAFVDLLPSIAHLLAELNMSDNDLDNACGKAIGSAIQHTPNMTTLKSVYNRLCPVWLAEC